MTDTAPPLLSRRYQNPQVFKRLSYNGIVQSSPPQYPWILHPQIQPTTDQSSTVCACIQPTLCGPMDNSPPGSSVHRAGCKWLLPITKHKKELVCGRWHWKKTHSFMLYLVLPWNHQDKILQPAPARKQFLPEGRVEGTLTFEAVEFTFLLEAGCSRMQQSVTLFSMPCGSQENRNHPSECVASIAIRKTHLKRHSLLKWCFWTLPKTGKITEGEAGLSVHWISEGSHLKGRPHIRSHSTLHNCEENVGIPVPQMTGIRHLAN